MKICLINNLYGEYAKGGAERVAEVIDKGLKKEGHEVFVISTSSFFPWNIISYYNLYKLPKFIRPLWHLINIFNIQSYFKIKKILQTEKPDLVMTHNLMGVGFLTPLAIKQCGIKHIHTLHDIQLIHPSGLMFVNKENKINSVFAKIYQTINKKLFSSPAQVYGAGKIDIVISPSEWLMQMHLKQGFFEKAKTVVLQNPTASCHSRDSRLRGNDNREFIFLFVGQVEKHKGVEMLIKSFQQLDNNYILKIVGDGKISKKEQGTALFAQNKIEFLGKKNPAEVQELMQKADCLVVPSLCYENQPTVIFEAQQNNLPVIASDIGGIPELLDEKFLFKAGDVESLKDKMQWILKHRDELQEITENNENKPKERSIEKYIDKILNL